MLTSVFVFAMSLARLDHPMPHSGQPTPLSQPVPFGLADPSTGRLYLRNQAGGIDAVDLRTGHPLWSSRDASVPVIGLGKRVAALAAGPRFVLLDADTGRPILESPAVPSAPQPSQLSGPDCSSRLRARVRDGSLSVEWETGGKTPSGVPLPDDSPVAGASAGSVRLDLSTGQVQAAPPTPPEPAPAAPLAGPAGELGVPPFWRGEAGAGLAALTLAPGKDGERLVLSLGPGAGPASPARQIELARGASVIPLVTSDGRHALVQALGPDPAAIEGTWTLFSLDTGEPLNRRLPLEPGAKEPTVVGLYLVYFSETTAAKAGTARPLLKVAEVSTGKVLWARPVAGSFSEPPRP